MARPDPRAPIGIFDSGVGGLSVLRHIRRQLPGETLCYFADAGYAPYGDRTESEIEQRTLMAAEHLLRHQVKAIVVACNTATAAAIAVLRAHYADLIMIGVEPGLKPAVGVSQSGRIGVLATSATLASTKYQQLCAQIKQAVSQTSSVHFIHQACPGLADRIELGDLDGPETLALLNKYLGPIIDFQVDTLVLGCTHYPFVEDSIQRLVRQQGAAPLKIIDTGEAIARHLERLLQSQDLLNPNQTTNPLHCITTGDGASIRLAMNQLLQLRAGEFVIQEIGCK